LLEIKQDREIDRQLAERGVVLWVRVRSAETEQKAQEMLQANGARDIRIQEIEIEKRLQDIPLHSWFEEPLGRP